MMHSKQTSSWIEPIEAAATRIAPYVRATPTIELERGAFGVAGNLFLKLELLQHTGSFKPRGAFNRILSNRVPKSGVIAASGGNHGAAVAYAASVLGYDAEIFVPTIASPIKIERLRSYNAKLNIVGENYFGALAESEKRAFETGALVVHAFDQEEVIAGQGTVGRELERQASKLDTVLVAVGGGGLIGGVAAWFRGDVKIIGVEPRNAPTLHEAMQRGEIVDVETGGIAADSLGSTRVGKMMFEIAKDFIDSVVLVNDDDIVSAQRGLWREMRLIAEPGGATALAALISGAYRPKPDERVGVLVCGGNADLNKFV
jgi:threonine dehydratase